MISLSDIKNAAERIAPYIRQTPLLQATCLSKKITEAELWLKLECLQPTGSFKVRGATNCLLTTPDTEIQRGIVTASGGNHGLAVARAASMAGVPATIFVPRTTSEEKLIKLAAWGATVKVEGSVWDEANKSALAFAAEHQCAYFHPFANPAVMAGQGTLALEILNELPDLDVILVAIGGGGLISGIATALKALKPSVRIIGIEPEGAPTLYASLQAGQVVTLPEITTAVATMACGRTDRSIFDVVRQSVDEIVLVSDQEMLEAARWLWFETGLAADLSGAAAAAALRAGKVRLEPGIKACALVCGSGQEGIG
ncbi:MULTISPECIES: threonine ammonia-lyase [Brenneria]|uniref:Threonine/serine dehydratase n=1 Tax=Brenneria nigrifluens DSM 30175 = ATCC 13028 TaxID=1121120 RepID=A0A2U1UWK6_9GAMM|nr:MULTISPECIES: threonine/serine dehydratase [Brenneria]EHD22563.1 Pyridoxal-5'-phosphate-dependent protein beta subunit [Brenneria sp. EniD312]PWC26064.1 threonine/serine dehydratase [Brenneria nigrifluens DSM 30175 = ATCC 13028]QCR05552.1 threonine/serine dehydratase [Brenneria nigrifluens DSM 30175 = ATCC 13028]